MLWSGMLTSIAGNQTHAAATLRHANRLTSRSTASRGRGIGCLLALLRMAHRWPEWRRCRGNEPLIAGETSAA